MSTPNDPAAALAEAARGVTEVFPRKHALKTQMLEIRIERLAKALAAYEEARIYPCDNCGTMRTKAEGGTCFTLCEECWEKEFGSAKSKKN